MGTPKQNTARAEYGKGGGLRIYATPVNGSETTLQLNLVAEPETDDQLIEAASSKIFLEEKAARFLDDKVLNASFEDHSIRFAIETLPGIDA